MLKPNTLAPLDFAVQDSTGRLISLQDTLDQYVVLYFYPRDNTPGCTTEACELRDISADLKKLKVRVIGVSKDSPESHRKFAQRHRLNFELWSDQNHQLLKSFGAWGEKKRFGKTYLGIIRSTFVIDPKGKIIKTWEKVKPAGHADEVLAFLKSII
ncbi:MAG TPA: thioredoxin-dependent thiol peroxidase [Patescibacteria group bacterium]|jgi:peroxiredoxin Q/BCP